jgi:hypothetical protein
VADRAMSGLSEMRAFVKTTARPRAFEPRANSSIDWAARDAALTQLREGPPVASASAASGSRPHV